MPTATFNVTSAEIMNQDIALIDATGADAAGNTAYTFNIAATVTLTGITALPLGAGGPAPMIDVVNAPQTALTTSMFRFN